MVNLFLGMLLESVASLLLREMGLANNDTFSERALLICKAMHPAGVSVTAVDSMTSDKEIGPFSRSTLVEMVPSISSHKDSDMEMPPENGRSHSLAWERWERGLAVEGDTSD